MKCLLLIGIVIVAVAGMTASGNAALPTSEVIKEGTTATNPVPRSTVAPIQQEAAIDVTAFAGDTSVASVEVAEDTLSADPPRDTEVFPSQSGATVNGFGKGSDLPILRTLGGLGVVVSLIIAGYFVGRKLAPQYFAKRSSERYLRVIETLPMGEKRSISVIQVVNKHFIVGNTPSQISLIAQLTEPISLPSEAQTPTLGLKGRNYREQANGFRGFLDLESGRSSLSAAPKNVSAEVRMKMRQLREALEQ